MSEIFAFAGWFGFQVLIAVGLFLVIIVAIYILLGILIVIPEYFGFNLWVYVKKFLTALFDPSMLKAIGIVLIPIFIAIGGWNVQQSIEQSSLDLNYVQMSAAILQNKEADPNLRRWAVSLLNKKSPVPFSEALQNDIVSGSTTLPSFFVPGFVLNSSTYLLATSSPLFLKEGGVLDLNNTNRFSSTTIDR